MLYTVLRWPCDFCDTYNLYHTPNIPICTPPTRPPATSLSTLFHLISPITRYLRASHRCPRKVPSIAAVVPYLVDGSSSSHQHCSNSCHLSLSLSLLEALLFLHLLIRLKILSKNLTQGSFLHPSPSSLLLARRPKLSRYIPIYLL